MRRSFALPLALLCHPAVVAAQMAVPDHDLTVPAGFKVAVFAENLGGVRFLALGPGGVVYASQPGRGAVLRLPDANHDGVADSVQVVASGLAAPFGIAFRGDTMYVAEVDKLVRFAPGAATKTV